MAYASLPKLVPIGSPRITPEDVAKNMITEMLKSEPVKRLLSQPNIVIKAISLAPSNQTSIKSSIINSNINKKKNNNNNNGNIIKIYEKYNDNVTSSNSHLDDEANLLPSKNDGKSEIALVPLKPGRKKCGHYEPCENIVCDVNFQQYVDYEGSSPILAFNIDESEINAPVTKHCENKQCDALSIDHDRCRRVAIRLCRYDKTNVCDICGISLKTRKSRCNHKNCKRKNIYQHNDIDNARILRERMRIKELQMDATLRMKKNNFNDPLNPDDRAIEILKKNSELIIIPKTPSQSSTKLTVRTILNNNNQSLTDSHKPPENINLSNDEISFVPKPTNNLTIPQKIILKKQTKNMKKPNNIDNNFKSKSVNVESTNSNKSGNTQLDSQIIVTGVPQGTVTYPLSKSDWIMAHTTNAPIMPSQKPYLMPVRVVPIANLKSEPSLLHQTQGIPKFCIIADNSASPQSFINLQPMSTVPIQKIQPIKKPVTSTVPNSTTNTSTLSSVAAKRLIKISPKQKLTRTINSNNKNDEKSIEISSLSSNLKPTREHDYCEIGNKRRRLEKKLFICTYCSKRFLTEWYFKMHIARHIGEVKAKCEICEKTFTHHYDLKRHVNIEHNGKMKDPVKIVDDDNDDNDDNYDDDENKNDQIEIVKHEVEDIDDDLSVVCDNCESIFNSHIDMAKHKCKKIVNNETSNGGVVIIDSAVNECNEEIEKENGIMRSKIVDGLPMIKLRQIAKNHKKIIRKRKNKNKKSFNSGSSEVSSSDSKIKC